MRPELMAALAAAAAACGDNHHEAPGDGAPESCVVRGDRIGLQQIAYGCGVEGAPAAPDCLAGVVTLVTSPPDDPRLFLVELDGRIRIFDRGHVQPGSFLDIAEADGGPSTGTGVSELGFLGLAFHPRYATNHQLFVYYTARNPDTADVDHPYLDTVARYTAKDGSSVDPRSGVVLIAIPDPFPNHNGGMIEFGGDGYLYVSTGDGGGAAGLPADPFGNAQNPHALLGKMLRIDVDRTEAGKPYGIPFDNPYASGAFGAPEVFLLGLRNPWRWSFDRATGDMWIGDVGAATIEEVDYLPAGQQAGRNLGWPMWEGSLCYAPPCTPDGMTFPVQEYNHDRGWWSVIGGQVYRGSCFPDLVGTYVYNDCGLSKLHTGRMAPDGGFAAVDTGIITINPASLHADARGELYQSDIRGNVWHVIATAQP